MTNIVVIPTYNERENIEKIIQKVFSLPRAFHILVVDDGSPDGTADIVKHLQKQYANALFLLQRTSKDGLGRAYIAGFKWAIEKNYDHIYEMDADFSHNPDDLVRMLDVLEQQKADIVVGSRYVKGGNVKNWDKTRILISKTGSFYVRLITGLNIKDTTSGFVAYNTKVLKSIQLDKIRFNGYGFQIEMKFVSVLLKFKLVEIPITFIDRELGTSKMNFKIVGEALLGVLQLQYLRWFKNYVNNMRHH